MTPTLPDWVRPMIARALGAVVAGLAAGIAKRYGYDVSAEEQRHITDWGATVVVTAVLFVYGVAHRALNARVNPTDSASAAMSKPAAEPFGDGARTRLGQHMEAAAAGKTTLPPDGIKIPRPPLRRESDVSGDVSAFAPPTVINNPTSTPPPAPPKKPRAPRKKKPADVVKVEREAPNVAATENTGFADYVPTAKDLPRHISPRPRVSDDDSGIL